jgi:hypothetical protein
MTSSIARLAAWFEKQCKDDWEHQFGVRIETLDNPGWSLVVDIKATDLELRPFESKSIERSDDDWVQARIDGLAFRAWGGPKNLEEMIDTFTRWANGEAVGEGGAPGEIAGIPS